jgi:hypothetical protein
MQPAEPVGSGEGDDCPVRPVHHDRVVLGATLFSERVAVVPDRSDIGRGGGCRHGGHT